MTKNVGTGDRIIRFMIGIAGIALGYMVSPWFYIVAVAGIGTGLIGFCGLYTLIGINTCPISNPVKPTTTSKP